MTRDTKTISAVFMAALLVLASGTAVSLAATDTGDAAVGATDALQETTAEPTTEAVDEETTEALGEEDEATTEAPDEETTAAAEAAASVAFNDQESDGEQVVIESVRMDEGGFVAIHDETLLEGDVLASVIGNSVYLEPGVHENVTVTLARPIEETQTLIAMPHLDTNDNEVYDFVLSVGEVDGPYVADGEAVVDQATVSVGAEEPVETETETEEPVETETEEPVDTPTETEEPVDTPTETETEEPVDTPTETETETEEPVDTPTETETETEEPVDTPTETEEPVEEPTDQQQFVFKVEQMNIDRWSFVVGDEETPDRTETVSDITVTDRRVEINLTELLQQQAAMVEQQQPITTQDPEEVQEQLQENLSQDLETVRFVIEDVTVENVTFVVTAPEDVEMPEPPEDVEMETPTPEEETPTPEEEETPEEETPTPEEEETPTPEEEETPEEETPTPEEEETPTPEEEETPTPEEEETPEEETPTPEEETPTPEEEETPTPEEETPTPEEETPTPDEEETPTPEEEETPEEETPTPEDLESFTVSDLDAPGNASVGDAITVSAIVANPNDVEASQEVAFRLQGDVIESQTVTLAGQEQTRVTFEIDTSELAMGEYIHGVYTDEFGELAIIMLNEPTAEETTEVVETETPEDGEEMTEVVETETPTESEETSTIVVETMTETTEAEA